MSSQAPSLIHPPYWEEAVSHLSRVDPVMGEIIALYQGETLTCKADPYFTLARAIVGQQISVSAADSVWRRLTEEVTIVSPETVLAAQEERLRACGLSLQKVSYLRNIAAHFHSRGVGLGYFEGKALEEINKELLAIKGVGPWTVQMFQIFYLMSPDIMPLGDLGLLNAIAARYGLPKESIKETARNVAEQWKPWRTVATWYLWRSLDPVPVKY
ncbi:MAG: HhH-GPD family protein [Rickettsiales bacterium]|jgi:DNA-3-methyladenine glycosylase II|nr:HhH-GPD family protein [Rickettsiales bacterium]